MEIIRLFADDDALRLKGTSGEEPRSRLASEAEDMLLLLLLLLLWLIFCSENGNERLPFQ